MLIISMGQSFILSANGDGKENQGTGFFGALWGGAKYLYSGANSVFDGVSSFVDGVDRKAKQAQKIARFAKYTAYCAAALIGYKTVVRPTSNFFFGNKGRKATSIIDSGLKWSFVAAIIAVPVCAFLYFNNKLNKISQDVKDLRETTIERFDKLDAKVDEMGRKIDNNGNLILNETKKNGQDLKEIKQNLQNLQNQVPSAPAV